MRKSHANGLAKFDHTQDRVIQVTQECV